MYGDVIIRENIRVCLFEYSFVIILPIYDTTFEFEPWIYNIIGISLLRPPDHSDFVNNEFIQFINTQHIFSLIQLIIYYFGNLYLSY